MASELTLIVDMVAALGAASVGGYIASRFQQPVLLGYLLGGIVVGPAGLGVVTTEGEIQTLAEIGVALLLFALGIEFSLTDLLRVRRIALGGGSLQVILTILLAGGVAYGVGWVDSLPKAVFLGAVISLSSTAVVLKSLIERNEVQTAHGQAMLAILIVQDLGLGVMLAVLPALTQPPDTLRQALLIAVLKASLFLAGSVLAGAKLIPPLMRQIARTGSQELFVLSVFALCLGVALLTAQIGLGIEMGAFVAGLMISQVEYADHALDQVIPMRDVFAPLFFTSIGILIDPAFLVANAPALVGLVTLTMVGKALLITPIVALFGYPLKTALTVGLGLNQIGEFSFVLAGVAEELGLFSGKLYGLTVGITAVTLLLTPFVLKATPAIAIALERLPGLGALLRRSQIPQAVAVDPGIANHIVVAGYGRVGQTLVRLLSSQGYQVVVIDNKESVIQPMRVAEMPYLFGDASSQLVLEKAHLDRALAMAIALPDPAATRLALKRALSLAPDLDITVRAHHTQEIDLLYQLGCREVVQPEFEASLEMGAHMLINLGQPAWTIQQVAHEYRTSRYRSLLPERPQFQVNGTSRRWPERDLSVAIEGLQGRWYTLEPTSGLAGQTLAEANIRRHTGATVMEIRRSGEFLPYPGPEVVLTPGDRLLVVGDPQERDAFELLLRKTDGDRH